MKFAAYPDKTGDKGSGGWAGQADEDSLIRVIDLDVEAGQT